MGNDPAVSVREGLRRYYEANAGVLSEREVSTEAREFFRCHDVAHVVFGCDTSLSGEAVLKIFTIFGTTLGFWKHLSGYAEASAFDLFRQYSLSHVLRHSYRLILRVPRAILRARRMSRPWPWAEHGEYLDRSLEEVRTEFNIVIIHW